MITLNVHSCAEVNPDGVIRRNLQTRRERRMAEAVTAAIALPATGAIPVQPDFADLLGPRATRRRGGGPDWLAAIMVAAFLIAGIGFAYVAATAASGTTTLNTRTQPTDRPTNAKTPQPIATPEPTSRPVADPEP